MPCARKRLPDRRLVGREGFERLGGLVGQLGRVGIIDGDAFGGAQVRGRGGAAGGA